MMSQIFHFVVAAFGGLLMCAATGAQMRGGVASARSIPVRPQSPAPVTTSVRPPGNSIAQPAPSAQANHQAPVTQITSDEHEATLNRTFRCVANFDSENGVPGLGFDRSQLPAASGNLQFGSANGRRACTRRNSVIPIVILAYPSSSDTDDPAPGDPSSADPSNQQLPQETAPAVEPQPANPVPEVRDGPSGTSTTAPDASQTADAPTGNVREFIFVRREGQVLFASAFSISRGQLRYVTPEGILRTIAVAELDIAATGKMNEAFGTIVDLNK